MLTNKQRVQKLAKKEGPKPSGPAARPFTGKHASPRDKKEEEKTGKNTSLTKTSGSNSPEPNKQGQTDRRFKPILTEQRR